MATRRGNGPGHGGPANGMGWGGPAKGEGQRAPGPGRPPGVKDGEGKASVASLMIAAGARELAAQRWLEILSDPAHPKHAEMVAKAADRMDGAPVQTIDAAIKQAVISSEPLSEDEWVATYGMGAAAGTAEGSS